VEQFICQYSTGLEAARTLGAICQATSASNTANANACGALGTIALNATKSASELSMSQLLTVAKADTGNQVAKDASVAELKKMNVTLNATLTDLRKIQEFSEEFNEESRPQGGHII
jgi:hypothetical protein